MQDDEAPGVGELRDPEPQMFRRGEEALADARQSGVCSIALWLAAKLA